MMHVNVITVKHRFLNVSEFEQFGFRTENDSTPNKNSVLKQLEQKIEQQRHVTAKKKRKHFSVDHRTRYSTFIVTLCFIVTLITFLVIETTCCVFRFIYNFVFYLLFE